MSRRLAAVVAVMALAGAAVLDAHLTVVKSLPARDETVAVSPKRLQVWFSETPAAGISQLMLKGASGAIEIGKTAAEKDKSIVADVPKPLAAGDYTIAWRTAGDDGHPATGEIKFKIAPKER